MFLCYIKQLLDRKRFGINMAFILRKGILGFLLAILSVAIVVAQGAACSDLVEMALASADANCGELGRNEVCYGYNNVQASFLSEVPDDFFDQVADKSPVADLASVQTLPMNTDTGQWGVAVMAIQAKLPNTLPGENIKFVLLGDVEVENAVAPENAFTPSEGVEISLAVDSANLRSGAGLNFNVVGGVQRGESILADGVSDNGQWLRVIKDQRPAWLSLSVVVDFPEIGNLPVLNDEFMMPMQAFYLRTGITGQQCVEAPSDVLVVQGPENFTVQLNINGANVSLGSSGAFRTINENGEDFLELTVFDGVFTIDGTLVTAGQQTRVCLGDEESRGLDGAANDLVVSCAPSSPRYVQSFGTNWCNIESLPSGILNYPINVQCPGETPPPVATTVNSSILDGTVAVDCNSFAILTGDIPATNFTLSWTPILGADSYEVAVFDNGGYQVSSSFTSGSSLPMNGGESFSSSGYVDVRAFGGGEYLCFARLSFSRSADPNEVLVQGPASPTINVFFDCSYDPGPEDWSIEILWSDGIAPVTAGHSGSAGTPANNSVVGGSTGAYIITINDPARVPFTLYLDNGDSTHYTYHCV
jgi:hypothetical protein